MSAPQEPLAPSLPGIDTAMRELGDADLLARLRLIGGGNATAAFRMLCTLAEVCSNCCLTWGKCPCWPERPVS